MIHEIQLSTDVRGDVIEYLSINRHMPRANGMTIHQDWMQSAEGNRFGQDFDAYLQHMVLILHIQHNFHSCMQS